MLDRLIRKEKLENLQYGSVVQVDLNNRRVLVSGRNGIQTWASYEPADFPDLAVNQTVAIAVAAGSAFLVRKLSAMLPGKFELLVV